MLSQCLLPDGKNLVVEQVIFDDEIIMVEITSTQPRALCPDCQQTSVRVHSRYKRTIVDLAWADDFSVMAVAAPVKRLWNGDRQWWSLMLAEQTDWPRNNVKLAGW